MTAERPTSYGELADILERLPQIVIDACRARGMSQRAFAAAVGLDPSTGHRMSTGKNLQVKNIVPILRWLDQTGGERDV